MSLIICCLESLQRCCTKINDSEDDLVAGDEKENENRVGVNVWGCQQMKKTGTFSYAGQGRGVVGFGGDYIG